MRRIAVRCGHRSTEGPSSLKGARYGRNTALHIAARRGRTKAIAALIASGADARMKNSDGHAPL